MSYLAFVSSLADGEEETASRLTKLIGFASIFGLVATHKVNLVLEVELRYDPSCLSLGRSVGWLVGLSCFVYSIPTWCQELE